MTRSLARIRAVAIFTLQLGLLTFVHLIGFILAAQLTGAASQGQLRPAPDSVAGSRVESPADLERSIERPATAVDVPDQQQLELLGMIVLVCLLNSLVLSEWIRRSTLSGCRLVAGVFFIFWMCLTVMPQSDTLFFMADAYSIVRQAAIMGLVICALFSIAALPILNRWSNRSIEQPARVPARWLWKLPVCAVVYVTLYLTFGYFVAWQNPEVRALYGGGELPGFWRHIASGPVLTRLIPFQFARGIVWTLLCFGMIRVSTGSRVSQAIIIGLVLAVVMNAQLMIPNPVMSPSVRWTHLVETAVSNFLFGVFCVSIWTSYRSGLSTFGPAVPSPSGRTSARS